jgi:hypothetical protein
MSYLLAILTSSSGSISETTVFTSFSPDEEGNFASCSSWKNKIAVKHQQAA